MVTDPSAVARTYLKYIQEGNTLPEPIELSHSKELSRWIEATNFILTMMWRFLSDYQIELDINPHDHATRPILLQAEKLFEAYRTQVIILENEELELDHLRYPSDSPGFFFIAPETVVRPRHPFPQPEDKILFPFKAWGMALITEALHLKNGELACEVIGWIEEFYNKDPNFFSQHELDSHRVCAVGYKGELVPFLTVFSNYRQQYRELFRIARGFRFDIGGLYPKALDEYVNEFLYAINEQFQVLDFLWKEYTGEPELASLILANRYYVGDYKSCEIAQDFRKYVDIWRNGATDEIGRRRLFRALNAAGFLLIGAGFEIDYAPDFERNRTLITEGFALMLEAAKAASNPLMLAENYMDRATFFVLYNQHEEAEHLYTCVINLLEPGGRLPEMIVDQPDLIHLVPSALLPDPILMIAYYSRGNMRAYLEYNDEDVIKDYKRADTIYPIVPRIWFKLVNVLTDFPEERLKFAYRYINYPGTPPKDDNRGNMMAFTIQLLCELNRKSDAQKLFDEFEQNFPDHQDIKFLRKLLKRRKKFFGLF